MTSDDNQRPLVPLLTASGLRDLLGGQSVLPAGSAALAELQKEDGEVSPAARLELLRALHTALGPEAIAQRLSSLKPESLELSRETCVFLIHQAMTILYEHQIAFPARQRKLDELQRRHSSGALLVGLLGITSSGKSAFLNVLMGEGAARLPEAAAPTTNTRVICWRGDQEQAWVHYQDASVRVLEGSSLAELEKLCDEREHSAAAANPVQWIEWASPTAQIPRGVQLIDTPGLDPDISLHDEITRNAIVRDLDVVVYMKPVRAAFTSADLSLLKSLVHDGQTVLLVLTKSDTVPDLYEGVQLLKSADERIQDAEVKAQGELRKHAGLRSRGVLTVSAYERRGLETFSRFLRSVLAARPTLLVLQQRRDLKYLLGAMADDLEDDQKEEPAAGRARGEASETAAFRAKLCTEIDRLRAQEQRLSQRWVGEASTPQRLAQRVLKKISADGPSAAKQQRARQSRRVGLTLGRWANADALALTRDASNTLIGLGVPLRQKAAEPPAVELDLKEAYLGSERSEKLSRTEAYRAEKGFLKGLLAFVRNNSYRSIDGPFKQVNFEADLRASLQQIEEPVQEALKWLEQHVMTPLQQRLEQEVHAQAEARQVRQTVDRATREAAGQSLRALAGLVTAIAAPPTPKIGPLVRSLMDPASVDQGPRDAHAALFGLLETFAETAIQEELLALLRRLTRTTTEPMKVLLLGHDRRPLLHLCALLAHNVLKSDRFPDAQPEQWLRLGLPIQLPNVSWADGHDLEGAGVPLFKQVSLVLAPADGQLAQAPLSPALLRSFDVVGIHLDAARLGHARANLRRAKPLYMDALSEARIPMFFVNGMGRDFGAHLSQLLTEVPEALATDYPAAKEWFVFDDYDVRFTRYMQLGRQVLAGKKSILALWREAGLLFSEPFSEEGLEKSIQAAQQKRRTRTGTQERAR